MPSLYVNFTEHDNCDKSYSPYYVYHTGHIISSLSVHPTEHATRDNQTYLSVHPTRHVTCDIPSLSVHLTGHENYDKPSSPSVHFLCMFTTLDMRFVICYLPYLSTLLNMILMTIKLTHLPILLDILLVTCHPCLSTN